jgi:hypothetical protein
MVKLAAEREAMVRDLAEHVAEAVALIGADDDGEVARLVHQAHADQADPVAAGDAIAAADLLLDADDRGEFAEAVRWAREDVADLRTFITRPRWWAKDDVLAADDGARVTSPLPPRAFEVATELQRRRRLPFVVKMKLSDVAMVVAGYPKHEAADIEAEALAWLAAEGEDLNRPRYQPRPWLRLLLMDADPDDPRHGEP